jgi:hypothetical protein
MGRRAQNRGKRNLFLNFFKFRTSGLLKTPLPPMSEFVLIFQTPLPPSARTSFVNGPLGKRSAILSCNETREKRDEYW